MKSSQLIRYLFAAVCIILLLFISWMALSGGIGQFPRSETTGQKAQTLIQLICSVLSLLVVITLFLWKKWSHMIQYSWAFSLVITAGLSALVWGPPMPHIALIFGIFTLLLSAGVLWMLRAAVQTEKVEV